MARPSCPPSYRGAFLGAPTHVALPPGERLYKMVSLPLDRARVLRSPWWIRHTAFTELQVRARPLQRPVADLVRAHLAVAMEWNPGMDVLWIVQLATATDAWEGRALQVCVPGLMTPRSPPPWRPPAPRRHRRTRRCRCRWRGDVLERTARS